MYQNSELFLTAFNRIEKEIKTMLTDKKEMGFSKATRMVSESNAVVRRYCNDLLEFAELRNAIVHNKVDMTYAIAEPHDSIVHRIERIEKELTNPPRVGELYSCDVVFFEEEAMLSELLKMIQQRGIAKFPIYEKNAFKGLVTHKGIARWLASHYDSPAETRLKDVLAYEKEDNCEFMPVHATVYDAIDLFKGQSGRNNRLEAILLTENGTREEPLKGIITSWDMMKR